MPKSPDKPRANSPGKGKSTPGSAQSAVSAGPAAPPMQATGQHRSLERGKATHKKNPGKRANQGG